MRKFLALLVTVAALGACKGPTPFEVGGGTQCLAVNPTWETSPPQSIQVCQKPNGDLYAIYIPRNGAP